MEATINVRLDGALKKRGDSVLAAKGISTSEAIRSLWQHMAQTHEVPDCIINPSRVDEEKASELAIIDEIFGFAQGEYSDLSDDELREGYMSRYA